MSKLRALLIGFAIGAWAISAAAQDPTCADTDTILKCFNKFANPDAPPDPVALTAATDAARDEELVAQARLGVESLLRKQAGLEGTDSPIAAALTNFLPLLTARLDRGAVHDDDLGLRIELNELLLPTSDDVKLQVILHDAALFEAIEQALPAATRDTRKAEFAKLIDNTDDVTFSFSWSPVGERIGRTHKLEATYLSPLLGEVQRAVVEEFSGEDLSFGMFTQELGETVFADREELPLDVPLSELRFDERTQLMARLPAYASNQRAAAERIHSLAEANRLFDFADLADNQPQLIVSVAGRARPKLVGPDQVTARVSYEHGFQNVNSFRRKCDAKRAGAADYLGCFKDYLADNAEDIAEKDRLAFSISYRFNDDYDFSSPVDSILLDLPKEHELSASFSFTRLLQLKIKGDKDKTRIAVNAEYETHFSDPNRNDRFVASASVSRTLGAGFTLGFGLVYANKPEFRGAADHEVTANLGLNFSFDRPKEES